MSATKEKHSAIPWRYEKWQAGNLYGFHIKAGDIHVGSLCSQEDAELIVRAVNNEKEREEALELALDVCQLIRDENLTFSEGVHAALTVLEAELERVLGKTTTESREEKAGQPQVV